MHIHIQNMRTFVVLFKFKKFYFLYFIDTIVMDVSK